MKDFTYYTPTEIIFGKQSERAVTALIRKYGGGKVLLHYGGSSAERSGLLGEIRTVLRDGGIDFVELGGVVPNPRLSKVYEGIALCRESGVDFILAVGGGSVIDSSKAIGYGVKYEGDVWDLFDGKHTPTEAVPVGVVLTIPAAGSEMSDSCVITRDEGELKRGCNSDVCRCRFAVMNPERTYTLPAYQTAAGVTDIMMHTMERYFSHDTMQLTDAVSEALLRTVKECGEKVLSNPTDYDLRSEIMWAGSLSHNGLTECGATKDFATHRIEHELSALYGATHGAGLAAVWPYWAEYVFSENPERFARFATNVLDIPVNGRESEVIAREGIEAMKAYFRSIGMPTNIPELIGRKATDEEIAEMAEKCSRGKQITVGNWHKLGYDDMVAIYHMANE